MGFGVFFVAYIITVIMIFRDVAASKVKYQEMIVDDIKNLENLSISTNDLQEDLQIRLKGIKAEDGTDDQLLGEAVKLTKDQFGSIKI